MHEYGHQLFVLREKVRYERSQGSDTCVPSASRNGERFKQPPDLTYIPSYINKQLGTLRPVSYTQLATEQL